MPGSELGVVQSTIYGTIVFVFVAVVGDFDVYHAGFFAVTGRF